MNLHDVKGFHKICISKRVDDGLSCVIQTCGLGGLRPNTVVLGWPRSPNENLQNFSYSTFLSKK